MSENPIKNTEAEANTVPGALNRLAAGIGESVVVKDYTFKVAYINEMTLVLEPMGPVIVGGGGDVK